MLYLLGTLFLLQTAFGSNSSLNRDSWDRVMRKDRFENISRQYQARELLEALSEEGRHAIKAMLTGYHLNAEQHSAISDCLEIASEYKDVMLAMIDLLAAKPDANDPFQQVGEKEAYITDLCRFYIEDAACLRFGEDAVKVCTPDYSKPITGRFHEIKVNKDQMVKFLRNATKSDRRFELYYDQELIEQVQSHQISLGYHTNLDEAFGIFWVYMVSGEPVLFHKWSKVLRNECLPNGQIDMYYVENLSEELVKTLKNGSLRRDYIRNRSTYSSKYSEVLKILPPVQKKVKQSKKSQTKSRLLMMK